jgi:hypothetical protein
VGVDWFFEIVIGRERMDSVEKGADFIPLLDGEKENFLLFYASTRLM